MKTRRPGPSYEPTPEEIQRACAALRATWTPAMELNRAGQPREPAPVEIPTATNSNAGFAPILEDE